MKRYNPSKIEPKWQKTWDQNQTYKADLRSSKPKYIAMSMFNYPSGAGIHIGHAMNYTISDVLARFKRQQGFESYHPVGWDAFGLPAENYAIKAGVSPQQSMATIIPNYHKQYKAMGWSNDWSKEVATHQPLYYKWTQWIFSEMYRSGLAYQDSRMQWWCDKCQTVLANEQVIDGKCWRHDNADDPQVEQREVKQWFLKITDYANELLEATDALDWTESVKLAQKNWIGRSQGAEIDFKVEGSKEKICVYTTRPDTVFGATFLVLAPEHPLVDVLTADAQRKVVAAYKTKSAQKTEIERQASKQKTGVATGGFVINPVNNQKIPVWIADYVLMDYGTGAVMAVPAHDERDNEFAKKYNLPIVHVLDPVLIRSDVKDKTDFVEKGKIVAIVENASGDILCIHWRPELAGPLFVGGTIEEGEKPEQTALREIREETGYTDLEVLAIGEETFRYKYFAHSKNVATAAKTAFVHLRLKSDTRIKPKLEDDEKAKFKVEWITKSQARQITEPLHKYAFDKFIDNKIYAGEGIIVNSGSYTNMPSSEVREKLVAELTKKGIATEKTIFKMRDWSVSRQRYWGAPIPIIYCSHCKQNIEKTTRHINFYNQDTWDSIVARTKTVESRADNPEEPERRFKNVKVGDYLRFVNKATNEVLWAKVTKARFFASLTDLYKDKPILKAISGSDTLPESLEVLEQHYARLADGYAKKIKKNGLVTWQFELLIPGVSLVSDSDLPVTLPEVKDYAPSGDGRSALARATDWLKAPCPECGKMGERETDTLDTYICSSWYMLRYFDPANEKQIFDSAVVNKWTPIDFYNGADHATAHMVYARFMTRFFYKKGLVNSPEPFKKFLFNGKVTAHDGQMFSKSKGNGVDPLEIINSGYGADALRTYLMFASPLELWTRWDPQGVPGAYRFLARLWGLVDEFLTATPKAEKAPTGLKQSIHRTIKKVTDDLEEQRYNTAIAAMMQCVNDLYKIKATSGYAGRPEWRFALESLVQLVAPFAPHIAEQLWHDLGHADSVHIDHWPAWDIASLQSDSFIIVVQVNGKLRARLEVDVNTAQADIERLALNDLHVKQFVTGDPKKIIYVPGKVLNIVA